MNLIAATWTLALLMVSHDDTVLKDRDLAVNLESINECTLVMGGQIRTAVNEGWVLESATATPELAYAMLTREGRKATIICLNETADEIAT